MLGDVRRGSRRRAGPHGGSLHAAVVVVAGGVAWAPCCTSAASSPTSLAWFEVGVEGAQVAASGPPLSWWLGE
jgi:hypothetical protein